MKINSFNPVAKAYSQTVAPYRFSQFLTLVHELKLKGNEKVLDIGSGPGELSMQIVQRLNAGGFLYGIDLSSKMIQLARETASKSGYSNTFFQVGDALNMEFEDNTFDIVVSSNAFPWVPNRNRFLQEVLRVLKPGGRFGLVALSNKCYKEFTEAFKKITKDNPGFFPNGKPFEIMGAKLHSLLELKNFVSKNGFMIDKYFQLSTEEPIKADEYLKRVNAIVNENYLDYLENNGHRQKIRNQVFQALQNKNGNLKITESSVFILAQKPKVN